MEEISREERAKQAFLDGYNCTQAIMVAFGDLLPVEERLAVKMASSFGGGMGRLREVCGSVSGMFLVAGMLLGYEEADDYEGKKAHYERIQTLAARFREVYGTIICRELLGQLGKDDSPVPSKRTPEYYKKRSCAEKIGTAARILDAFLKEQ